MGESTNIEWTDATWNPVRGCSRVSEGCRNCYAETVAARFSGPGQAYEGFADRLRAGSKWTGKVDVVWPLIDLPLRWRKPRRIFVNSMSDLFHQSLSNEEIATIYAVAVAAHHLRGHTFQMLTKRPFRMRELFASEGFWQQVNAEAGAHVMDGTDPLDRRSDDARAMLGEYGSDAPPPGIWLGVSVENQPAADDRVPYLRATPAAVRFLSCEPLLGPVQPDLNGISWVIAGGESGPGARPMHPDWARSLRDQCAMADVPFFFKQWGEWAPEPQPAGSFADAERRGCTEIAFVSGSRAMERVGKKRAGALLDGREHRALPA